MVVVVLRIMFYGNVSCCKLKLLILLMMFSLLRHLRLSVDAGRNSSGFLGQFSVPLKVRQTTEHAVERLLLVLVRQRETVSQCF